MRWDPEPRKGVTEKRCDHMLIITSMNHIQIRMYDNLVTFRKPAANVTGSFRQQKKRANPPCNTKLGPKSLQQKKQTKNSSKVKYH